LINGEKSNEKDFCQSVDVVLTTEEQLQSALRAIKYTSSVLEVTKSLARM